MEMTDTIVYTPNEVTQFKDVASKAADYIETHGFRKHLYGGNPLGYGLDGPACQLGAARTVASISKYKDFSRWRYNDWLSQYTPAHQDAIAYNDDPNTTKEDVIAMLRRAANS